MPEPVTLNQAFAGAARGPAPGRHRHAGARCAAVALPRRRPEPRGLCRRRRRRRSARDAGALRRRNRPAAQARAGVPDYRHPRVLWPPLRHRPAGARPAPRYRDPDRGGAGARRAATAGGTRSSSCSISAPARAAFSSRCWPSCRRRKASAPISAQALWRLPPPMPSASAWARAPPSWPPIGSTGSAALSISFCRTRLISPRARSRASPKRSPATIQRSPSMAAPTGLTPIAALPPARQRSWPKAAGCWSRSARQAEAVTGILARRRAQARR